MGDRGQKGDQIRIYHSIIATIIANVTKNTIHDLVCKGKTHTETEDVARSAALLIINNHSHHATDSCHLDKPTAVTAPVLDFSDDIKQNKKSPSDYSSDFDTSDDTSNRGHKILSGIYIVERVQVTPELKI